MTRADPTLPEPTSHAVPAAAASGTAVVSAGSATRGRTGLQKCREVLKVLLRTTNDIRRLLRDTAAEIGEIVGGDLGREIGRLGASFLLGLMSEALLGDTGSQSVTGQMNEVV